MRWMFILIPAVHTVSHIILVPYVSFFCELCDSLIEFFVGAFPSLECYVALI
jgi:hypothetical protein